MLTETTTVQTSNEQTIFAAGQESGVTPNEVTEGQQRAALRATIDRVGHNKNSSERAPVRGQVLRLVAENWSAPPLLELLQAAHFASALTWTGDIDRFELVKSAQRTVNRRGQPLTEDEVEYLVAEHERTESFICDGQLVEAMAVCEDIVERFPNSTLAYFKLAVLQLALLGASGMQTAALLLRQATQLEPTNSILRGNVDLVLRMHSHAQIPEDYWTAKYPKSKGILRALETLVMRTTDDA